MSTAPRPFPEEAVLAQVVDTFYARVQHDEMLGPVFADAIENWPEHLEKLTAFWSRVMLGVPGYDGSPPAAHALHRDRITPAHFERWLALWGEVTAEVAPPELAEALQARAGMMAQGLMGALRLSP